MSFRQMSRAIQDFRDWPFVILLSVLILANGSAYYTRSNLMGRLGAGYFDSVRPAQQYQNITGRTIDGSEKTISFDRKTLLFLLSPKCRPCISEISYWNELFWALRSEEVEVVGISIGANGLKNYITAHGIWFPVVALADPKVVNDYGMNHLPMTIVISAGGRLEEHFITLDDSRSRGAIETLLEVGTDRHKHKKM